MHLVLTSVDIVYGRRFGDEARSVSCLQGSRADVSSEDGCDESTSPKKYKEPLTEMVE